MKKLMTLRQRGYDLLQISLGIAIVLGLMVGGLMLFNQVQTSSELSETTRNAVAISSEVRAQYRTQAAFEGDGIPVLSASNVQGKSGMNAAMFNNVTLTGSGQTFTAAFANLNDTVCSRLNGAVDELGPNSVAACDTDTGTLTVTYSR